MPTQPGRSRPLLASLSALLLLVLTPPGDAFAEGPAVEQLNGRVLAAYLYESLDSAAQTVGNTTVFAIGAEGGGWDVAGVLTTPVPRIGWLGGRLTVAGGRSAYDHPAFGPIPSNRTNQARISSEAMVFARDPELGHIGVGYRFAWSDSTIRTEQSRSVQGATLEAGFFIPDQGIGPIDWNVRFVYGHATLTPGAASGQPESVADEYTVLGTMGFYLLDSLRLSGGALYERIDPEPASTTQLVRGVGALDWLLPVSLGGRRLLTLGAFGSGGYADQAMTAPFDSMHRTVWSVGGALVVSYPGATSLLELTRRYY